MERELSDCNEGHGVRQWQELFYDRRYVSTCMRYRKGCEAGCNQPDRHCPAYTPDFVRLAQSYGAKGLRVTEAGGVKAALESAKRSTKVPTVIEFIIDRECNVMPIVPPGNSLDDMIDILNPGGRLCVITFHSLAVSFTCSIVFPPCGHCRLSLSLLVYIVNKKSKPRFPQKKARTGKGSPSRAVCL